MALARQTMRRPVRRAALVALLIATIAHPLAASALTAASGDTAAWLYATSNIVRIDIKTSASLGSISASSWTDATFKLTRGSTTYGALDGSSAWAIKLRLKGTGSFRSLPSKGGLRLEFPTTSQRVSGIKRMTLNNMVQDRSKVSEAVGYTLFRALGIAAPRTGYAQVWINSQAYGLYLNVESLDGIALDKRNAIGGTSHLYEGVLGRTSDATDSSSAHYQVDVGTSDRSDLSALLSANSAAPASWYASVNALANLQEMTKVWAVERYIGHWNGYSSPEINNYYLHSPTSGKFEMLPWGIDQIFGGGTDNRTPYSFGNTAGGPLFVGCMQNSTCRAMYVAALTAVKKKSKAIALDDLATSLHASIKAAISLDAKDETSLNQSNAALASALAFIRHRPTDLATWLKRN
jgi:spore coat protein CotH